MDILDTISQCQFSICLFHAQSENFIWDILKNTCKTYA